MPKLVEVVGGKRPVAFPWGTLPRAARKTFELDDAHLPVLDATKSKGLIVAYTVIEGGAAAPSTAPNGGQPAGDTSSRRKILEEIYETVFSKQLSGNPSRDELLSMYKELLGKKAGKKKDDRTLIEELCDAFSG